jgi:hypothetical protein
MRRHACVPHATFPARLSCTISRSSDAFEQRCQNSCAVVLSLGEPCPHTWVKSAMREEAEHIELPRELAAIDTRTQSGGLWDLGEDLGRGAVGLTFVDNRLAQPAGFYSVQCPLVQYR